jgi:hypothetical protein
VTAVLLAASSGCAASASARRRPPSGSPSSGVAPVAGEQHACRVAQREQVPAGSAPACAARTRDGRIPMGRCFGVHPVEVLGGNRHNRGYPAAPRNTPSGPAHPRPRSAIVPAALLAVGFGFTKKFARLDLRKSGEPPGHPARAMDLGPWSIGPWGITPLWFYFATMRNWVGSRSYYCTRTSEGLSFVSSHQYEEVGRSSGTVTQRPRSRQLMIGRAGTARQVGRDRPGRCRGNLTFTGSESGSCGRRQRRIDCSVGCLSGR